MLHVMLEDVQRTAQHGPGADHIKALAVLADIGNEKTNLWWSPEECGDG
jgi:hypothetical protein